MNYIGSDIIVCTETKLRPSDLSEDYKIPGFQLYRFDYPRAAHGLAVFAKYDIQVSALRFIIPLLAQS